MVMAGTADSWPYYFLNSLTPPGGTGSGSTQTLDSNELPSSGLGGVGVGGAGDSDDLQKQLEAWTNITFDFDDEPVVDPVKGGQQKPAAAVAAEQPSKPKQAGEGAKMAGMMSSSVDGITGYHPSFDSFFHGHPGVPSASTVAHPNVSGPGDTSPYDPRRGVGTGHHHMHQLFPGPQEHAFRLSHHPHAAHLAATAAPPATASPHLGAFSLPPLLQSTPSPVGVEHQQQQHLMPGMPLSFSTLLASPDGLNSILRAGAAGDHHTAALLSRSASHQNGGIPQGTNPFANLPELHPIVTASGAPTSFADLIGGASSTAPASVPMAASSSLTGQTPAIEEPLGAGARGGGGAGKRGVSRRNSTIRPASATVDAGAATPSDSTPIDGDLSSSFNWEDDDGNKLSVEEDKRRRNTAASARFRIKKKLREQAVERTAQELRDKVTELEKEVDGLKKENGWLRGLIVERASTSIGAGSAPSHDLPPPPVVTTTPGGRSKRRRHDYD